jgi:hypothetical protein
MLTDEMTVKSEKKQTVYSFDEAVKASLEYFKGDELAGFCEKTYLVGL